MESAWREGGSALLSRGFWEAAPDVKHENRAEEMVTFLGKVIRRDKGKVASECLEHFRNSQSREEWGRVRNRMEAAVDVDGQREWPVGTDPMGLYSQLSSYLVRQKKEAF